jgi:hypothetical protein
MTSTQLAAIAYRLGTIDSIRTQLVQLMMDLEDLEEGSLSVKFELALRAFDERAAEHRKTLNQYAHEISIDPPRFRQGRQVPPREQENL